jgi:hypothetical protein
MARFEDAIMFVQNGGRARRKCWANVVEFTRTTPPLNFERRWHIWMQSDVGGIVQGWGGSIGGAADDDPIRDGTGYSPSDEDRTAFDWELIGHVR